MLIPRLSGINNNNPPTLSYSPPFTVISTDFVDRKTPPAKAIINEIMVIEIDMMVKTFTDFFKTFHLYYCILFSLPSTSTILCFTISFTARLASPK